MCVCECVSGVVVHLWVSKDGCVSSFACSRTYIHVVVVCCPHMYSNVMCCDVMCCAAPVFLKSGVNASLYQLGEGDSSFPVVHVWGNAYETGYAQGVMQKEYMRQFLAKTYDYFLNLVVEELPGPLPPLIQDKIILLGLNGALDWCAEVTAPYTPQEFYDELQGCADGAGVDYQTLLRLNMFAEITKASCSFFGAWGSATSDAEGTGNVYQLRALDYDTDGPFKDFPQITVYHPSEEGASPFANVGWPGSIGVLSGFNSHRMGISEIGASFADDSFGQGELSYVLQS